MGHHGERHITEIRSHEGHWIFFEQLHFCCSRFQKPTLKVCSCCEALTEEKVLPENGLKEGVESNALLCACRTLIGSANGFEKVEVV